MLLIEKSLVFNPGRLLAGLKLILWFFRILLRINFRLNQFLKVLFHFHIESFLGHLSQNILEVVLHVDLLLRLRFLGSVASETL